jgi:predicted membrane protein
MMNNSIVPYMITQLGYQAPGLLVYMVAFVLSLVFMRRALLPSILTLLGIAVLVITTFALMVIQAYLIQNNNPRWLTSVGVGGNCIRAIGLSLLVAAIFVGRQKAMAGPFDPRNVNPRSVSTVPPGNQSQSPPVM